VRYGEGSPHFDTTLPCGGGICVLLLPRPTREPIADLLAQLELRQAGTLEIDTRSGDVRHCKDLGSTNHQCLFRLQILPPVQLAVFGEGAETSTFCLVAQSLDMPVHCYTPDKETLRIVRELGGRCTELRIASSPPSLSMDSRTAAILFFHDHDWEAAIILACLKTEAFYIGAQGSRRSSAARLAALRDAGCTVDDLRRIKGPVGLIPSARDTRTLTISAMAEILSEAKGLTG
jgi:xanthine dehydrogenase accessory factor